MASVGLTLFVKISLQSQPDAKPKPDGWPNTAQQTRPKQLHHGNAQADPPPLVALGRYVVDSFIQHWQRSSPFCLLSPHFSLAVAVQSQFTVPNEICTTATPLDVGGSVVQGTTVNGTVTDTSLCWKRHGISHGDAPGVWYSVVGTGSGIRAYTCADAGADSVLNKGIMTVYRGNCSRLQCVSVSIIEKDENKCIAEGDDNQGAGEVISWFGLKDVTYYLLVRGTNGADVGTFDLEIKHLPSLANHDVCRNALPVDNQTRVDDQIGGNRSSIDFVTCSVVSPGAADLLSHSSGLWYQFEGTGQRIRVAPPCGGREFVITMYTGEPCGQQLCVGRSLQQNVCGPDWGNEPVVVVDTNIGQTYHVLVRHVTTSTIQPTSFYLQFDDVTTSGSGRQMTNFLSLAVTVLTAVVMWQ